MASSFAHVPDHTYDRPGSQTRGYGNRLRRTFFTYLGHYPVTRRLWVTS